MAVIRGTLGSRHEIVTLLSWTIINADLTLKLGRVQLTRIRRTLLVMKQIGIIIVTLATMWFATRAQAQGTLQTIHPNDTSYAPLLLFTNGEGQFTPYQAGQLLEVGQTYTVTAVPADGYVFTGWQQANVFTTWQVTVDGNGDTNPPVISTIVSINPGLSSAQPQLEFILQSPDEIYDNPGVSTITESVGWQADFTPVPEPATTTLTVSGITLFTFLCRRPTSRSIQIV